MRKVTRYARKIAVIATGFPIVILGIILIPLPGPGILVSLLGFLILSLEFEWAGKYVDKAKSQLQKIIEKSQQKSK